MHMRILGSGDGEPLGILSDDSAKVGVSTDIIYFEDVMTLYFSLDPELRTNAVWLMNDSTALFLKQLTDMNGMPLWNHNDDTIFGRPVYISNFMPSMDDGNKPIAFGDFSYYWIIKGSPVTMKILKELFAINNQIGYRCLK